MADEPTQNSSGTKEEAELLSAPVRERLERHRQRRDEIQARLRSFLSIRPPDLEKARLLVQGRWLHLYLEKALLRGADTGGPQDMTEAERNRIWSDLDREANLLLRQLVTLNKPGAWK